MSDKYTDEFLKVLNKLKDNLIKVRGDEDDEDYDVQDHDLGEEDLEGLSIVDDPFQDEDDEAAKWLKEQEGGGTQEAAAEEAPDEEEAAPTKEKKVSSSGYTDWAPHGEYTPEHEAGMKKLMDEGYSHREAERLVGAHRGPSDFQSALTHSVRPSQPSEKMLSELKDLAGPWLENASRHSKLTADPEKNPQKFAAGQMLQAHEKHSKDYNKDYHDFLSSGDVKDLKGRDRHKAIREWKNKWHEDNPQYKENIGEVSSAQKHYIEAPQAAKRSLDERIAHITSGGVGMPTGMSMAEAAQHVGGQKTDEGYSAATVKDPSVSFAQQNPELLRVLKQHKNAPELMDRLNRVNAARASKGVKIRKKGEA
jgi:hypothetical protein